MGKLSPMQALGGKRDENFLLTKMLSWHMNLFYLYAYVLTSCSVSPDKLEGAESSHTVVKVTAQNETGSLNRILKAFRVSR